MRLMMTLGLACLMLVPVCAAEQPAQPAKVSVSFSDADAGQALIELAQKAQLTVLGDATVKGKVNASLNNVTPEQALDTICRTNNLEWYKAYISVAPNEKPNAQKVLALFLIGLRVARRKLLIDPAEHRYLFRRDMFAGVAIGLSFCVLNW